MKKTFREFYELAKKLNRQRGGDDWNFDHDNRLDVTQEHGGVSLSWFDRARGIYRRSYVRGAILIKP